MKLVNKLFSLSLAIVLSISMLAIPSNTLTAEAASSVTINGVCISGSNVLVATSGFAASEDGLYHLFAQDPNQSGVLGIDVAQVPAANGASFTVPLNKNSASSLLFKKFTIVGVSGGQAVPLSNSMYITNPEACASRAVPRMDRGKKGLVASTEAPVMYQNNIAALGAKQVTLNIPLSKLSNGRSPYNYNGKNYYFNTSFLGNFDSGVRRWNNEGAQVTVILLVDKAADPNFINPLSMSGAASGQVQYLSFNAYTTTGCEYLAALGSFISQHYSCGSYGQVDNFIIGNEVNAWYQWNYLNAGSLQAFTQQYANAFRLLYNGIKSENANANVYVCTDQQWGRAAASYYYGGKEFLTCFNNYVKSEGNIDWRLATHAYNVPLYDVHVWAKNGNLTHSQNSPFISCQNIDVVTDFLCQPDFRSPSGAVRTVKLSEQGFTSHTGQDLQAVAVTYAIMVANNNRYIDGIIISREKDDYGEITQGLQMGLMDLGNNHKVAWDFYINADNPTYQAAASQVAGVDLHSLITPR